MEQTFASLYVFTNKVNNFKRLVLLQGTKTHRSTVVALAMWQEHYNKASFVRMW